MLEFELGKCAVPINVTFLQDFTTNRPDFISRETTLDQLTTGSLEIGRAQYPVLVEIY